MNSKPNDIVALEWLMPPLNETLAAIHATWHELDDDINFADFAQQFHDLGNVLFMANLALFARLAYVLESACLGIANQTLSPMIAPRILYASRLLQYELERHVLFGLDYHLPIGLRIHYLNQLLAQDDGQETISTRFSDQLPDFEGDENLFDEAVYQKLSVAWQHEVKELLRQGKNDATILGNLGQVLDHLKQATTDHVLQSLWHVGGLWLASLAMNDKPIPDDYAHLLSELEKAIATQQLAAQDEEMVIWLENTIVDIYAQLGDLTQVSQETARFLNILKDGNAQEQAFFPRILSMLEGVLFSLAEGHVQIETLEEIKERLGQRGWSFYETYTEQIISDIKNAKESDELFLQMQWQLNTQLQDLYGGILSTHEAIENKIGESIAMHTNLASQDGASFDQIRRVRILVEDLKFAFGDYLHSKAITQLPADDIFVELDQTFGEMGMYDVVAVVEQMAQLVTSIRQMSPEKISWQFADAAADGLSLLELFLDGLAKQVFDMELLDRARGRIQEALTSLGVVDEQAEFGAVVVLHDVVRYDDTGEIAPQVSRHQTKTDDHIAHQDMPKAETPVPSAAYLAAKAQLKEDNFDFDEDIREIFIEEADEVLAELNELLPVWQKKPDNLVPLKEIRRGFHTLKGSGRMVGAFGVGEMAWAVENMLNRVLDNTIESGAVVANFIAETATLIPTLVQDFQNKRPPSLDPAIIVLKANNILAGKPIDEGVPSFDTMQARIVSEDTLAVDDESVAELLADIQSLTAIDKASSKTTADLPTVLEPFILEAQTPVVAAVDDVDDDIKEIFIEEADEVLAEIIPLFEKWYTNQSAMDLLTDVRRGFHTLKGSGRMVAAVELGELAWSIENMLNRVLDSTVAVNEGMCALVNDVLQAFAGLVDIFEKNLDNYPKVMTLWIACAHAYSKNHGSEFDYRDVLPIFKEQSNVSSVTDEGQIEAEVSKVATDEPHQNRPSVEALNSIQEASVLMSSAALLTPANAEEATLCEMFIDEARDLLADVKAFLASVANQETVALPDDIVRIFHTLRGASGLTPLIAISKVGAVIEKGLQGLQQSEALMTTKHIAALGSAVKVIEHHLAAYEANVAGRPLLEDLPELAKDKHLIENLITDEQQTFDGGLEVANLIQGIDTLLDAELELETIVNEEPDLVRLYADTMLSELELLESRTLVSSKFQRLLRALSNGYQVLSRHPEQAGDDDLIDALLVAHHALTALFDSIAGSMSLQLEDSVVHALDTRVSDIQGYYRALDDKALVVGSTHEKSHAQEVSFQEIDTDPELLEIFLEEAGELDAAIGEAFSAWRDEPNNIEHLKALQRHLHTIKGGARLAGISSIGDLTHEAETAYEQMVDGRLTPSGDWVRVMQGVQDILSLQIEEIKRHQRSFFACGAVTDLQSFLDAKEVPEGASLALPILDEAEEKAETTVVATEDESEADYIDEQLSDFVRRQQRSWQGNLPDEGILSVFLEEAEELVETSTEDFQAFRSNTGDVATLQSLQRKLHTIKGGARMVGANGAADLAHHMETVYEDLGSRRRPATRMVIQLLLSCHDWFTQAMQLLKARLNPPKPTALIDALEQFSRRPDSLVEVPVVSLAEELDAIATHEAYEKQRRGGHDITRMPPMKGFFEQSEENVASANEMIRISSGVMERMINLSGEAAINRARIDMSMTSLVASIEEMGVTVQRLADQLRRMDIELEAQILAQIDDKGLFDLGEFDPLEMDQYSSLNQLSKSLSESASDLLDLKATMLDKTRDGENLLLQLSRTQAELQDGLMNSRMVPFSRLTPRLQRIARQISSELGKSVELSVLNVDDEMDRTILERITSPLEHMLRNAIDHGIELPDERLAMGKSKTGHITLEVVREGGEILVHLTDDGAGINVEAVRKKAIKQGLIDAKDDTLSDLDIMQYIFNAGLSTTNVVTQISGRGVGMDVVRSEIRQLGGSVSVESERGKGSRFTMRVPLTVAVSDTLVVRAADRQYAVPLVQIERVVQANPRDLLHYYQSSKATFDIDGVGYRLRYLNEILSGHHFTEILSTHASVPVIIIKNQTGQNLALHVDEIVGSRIEMVVKPLGRQLSNVAGISSATIMGDGSVLFILDLMALIRNAQARVVSTVTKPTANKRPTILVVDDSVTVRKVTSRFLERQGFEAVVAKDGVDAIEMLQELTPDLMLLDIEMPRMDGFEVATQVRHNTRLKSLPIIMITSRTGEKHRERAFEIGVNDYMGKPFQENELLTRIQTLLAKK